MNVKRARHCEAMRQLILDEKLYRDPLLTRWQLIDRLGIGKNQFVAIFRQGFGMSFIEYVNRLRMQEALTLLQDSSLSILEISEQAGFGTERTFRRQFQSQCGMSPSAYRKTHKKQVLL